MTSLLHGKKRRFRDKYSAERFSVSFKRNVPAVISWVFFGLFFFGGAGFFSVLPESGEPAAVFAEDTSINGGGKDAPRKTENGTAADGDSAVRPPAYQTLQPLSSQEGIPLYLMNKDGRLVVIPGFRLEQLEQMMRGGEAGPRVEKPVKSTAFPDYVIHNVRGTGEIGRNFVRLAVTFEMETFLDTPVCVPLRFNNGVLLSPGKMGDEAAEKNVEKAPENTPENVPGENAEKAEENASVPRTPGGEIRRELQLAHAYEGPGRLWMEFRQDDAGFTAWVLGKGQHKLHMDFLVPVTLSGEVHTVHIPFPQATMSEIAFELPQTRRESERLTVSVSEGGTLLPPAFFPAHDSAERAGDEKHAAAGSPDEKGLTRFSVMQLKNEMHISWREPERTQEISRTVLEVEGVIGTTVEKSDIRFQTRLKVDIHGAPTDHFRVRLPAGAELVPVFSPDYTVTVIPEAVPFPAVDGQARGEVITETETGDVYVAPAVEMVPSETPAAETLLSETPPSETPPAGAARVRDAVAESSRVVVEVCLKEKTSGTVYVDLYALIHQEMNTYSEWLDLGGFEVLDAARQTGYYAVRTHATRHHLWAPGAGVRHVDALPASVLGWMQAVSQPGKETSVSGMKAEAGGEAGHPNGIRGSAENEADGGENGPGEEDAGGGVRTENPGSAENAGAAGAPGAVAVAGTGVRADGEAEQAPSAGGVSGENSGAAGIGGAETASVSGGGAGVRAEGGGVRSEGGVNPDGGAYPAGSAPHENGARADGESRSAGAAGETAGWDAFFEYTSQPMMLLTRLVTRSVRFNVEPEYDVTVTENEVLLKGTWKCFIRGGKIAWIDVDFQDWIFESVGPDNLISVESLEVDADGRMSIPLIQPTTGNLTLTFQARRKIKDTDTELAFSFPRPVANHAAAVVQTVASADIRIRCALNVELTPNTERIRHLVRVPRSMAGSVGAQTPNMLFYRGESPEAIFVASRTIHPQQVAVREFSRLEVYPEEYRVCQTYEYTVSYVPLRQLKFTLPEVTAQRVDVLVTEQAHGVGVHGAGTHGVGMLGTGTGMAGTGVPGAPVLASSRTGMTEFPMTGHPQPAFPLAAQPGGTAVTGAVPGAGPISGMADAVADGKVRGGESVRPSAVAARDGGAETVTETGVFSSHFSTRRPMVTMNPPVNPAVSGAVNAPSVMDAGPRKMDVTVLLGEEKIGVFYVTFVYTLPMEKLQPQASRVNDFLLGVPHDGKLADNRLQVFTYHSIRVFPLQAAIPETPWQEVSLSAAENYLQTEMLTRVQQEGMTFIRRNKKEPAGVGGEGVMTGVAAEGEPRGAAFSGGETESAGVGGGYSPSRGGYEFRMNAAALNCWSPTAENRVSLALELKETDPLTVTIVDRYWLQTWMTGKVRQDRAVFCFPPVMDMPLPLTENGVSGGERKSSGGGGVYARKFTIQLPAGASADEADVWIDRRPAEIGTQVKRLSANSLQVTLEATRENLPRTVEIRYQFAKMFSTEEALPMEIPYVVDATWIRGMYWQVVLPGNMHIMTPPQGFSMEYRWGWNHMFWGRVPLWEQTALEQWCGAIQGAPVPVTMNRYVFAGMGSRDTLKDGVSFRLVNRTTLVVVLAFTVFILGFIFIHFSWTHHPLFLLGLLVAVGAVGVRYPDLALLALQASALGAVLVVISLLFNIFYRPQATGQGKTKYMMEQDTTVSPSPRAVIVPVTDELSPTRTYTADELGMRNEE